MKSFQFQNPFSVIKVFQTMWIFYGQNALVRIEKNSLSLPRKFKSHAFYRYFKSFFQFLVKCF